MPANVQTAFIANAANYDTDGYFDVTHPTRLNILTSGLYSFTFRLDGQNSLGLGEEFALQCTLRKNGATYFTSFGTQNMRDAQTQVDQSGLMSGASPPLLLFGGDYVEAMMNFSPETVGTILDLSSACSFGMVKVSD